MHFAFFRFIILSSLYRGRPWPRTLPPLTLGIGQIDGRDCGTDKERPKQHRRELEPVLADDTDDVAHPDAGQRPETLGQPHRLLQQFQILHFRSVHAVNLRIAKVNS